MRAAGVRTVGDAGDVGHRPERIAVVAERFRAEGNRAAFARRGVRLLETRHEWIVAVQAESVADNLKINVDRRFGPLGDLLDKPAELLLDVFRRCPWQPPARSLQAAFLRVLIENLS